MIWQKISIETIPEAVDMISYTLGELGVEGIEVEDKIPLTEEEKQAMFIDILPELPPDDGIATVSCYVDEDVNLEDLSASIQEALEDLRSYMDIGSGTMSFGKTEDKDWRDNWKTYFHAFQVGRLLIKPTWIPMEEVEATDWDTMIEIDPGTAFGTGSHETTMLCIEALEDLFQGKYPLDGLRKGENTPLDASEKSEVSGTTQMSKNDANGKNTTKTDENSCAGEGLTVLDVGCGSGILSIVAEKFGAGLVFGVDIDEIAVDVSMENGEINHINKSKVKFQKANLLEAPIHIPKVDVAVANILADVIVPLSGIVGDYLKDGGYFISSGIIDMKEEGVKKAILEAGFTIQDVRRKGEWVCFVARKPVA